MSRHRESDFRESPTVLRPAGAAPQEPPSVDPVVQAALDDFLRRNPGGAERLIPLLHLAQASSGYVSAAIQERIAERLGLPPVQVHGVVSFYPYFNTTPQGTHQLKVCMGTACFVRRARALTEAIRQVLGLEVGAVTKDGSIGLQEVRCLGSCGLAPAMMLNEELHGNLTPGDARKLVLGLQSKVRRERPLPPPEEL